MSLLSRGLELFRPEAPLSLDLRGAGRALALQEAAERRDMISDSGDPGTSLENPRNPLTKIFEIEETASGKTVTEATALNLSAVWRCVSLIAGAVARTPFLPYRREITGKEIARNHYLFPLLTVASNAHMTAYRFKRVMQTWALLWGNAYAEFECNQRGQIVALWPWRPDRVTITPYNGDLLYTYRMNDGTPVTRPSSTILHIRGLETDGVKGLSPIAAMRQSLGLMSAAEEYGARFFRNNGRPGGWVEHPMRLGKEAAKNLRESLEGFHMGLKNSHRLGILEEGMKYHEVGVTPEDMQFLQTRQFQAIDVARWYGVPPHKIAELSRATFSNIGSQKIEFVDDCLDDWFVNWECEAGNSLLSTRELQAIELRFYRAHLLRGEIKERYEAYAIARSWGAMNANEWRELEGMNRRTDPGGDVYIEPLNYQESGVTDPDSEDPEAPDSDEGTEPAEGSADDTAEAGTVPAAFGGSKTKAQKAKKAAKLAAAGADN